MRRQKGGRGINQAERAAAEESINGDINDWLIAQQLKDILPKMEQVYDISRRHELMGESVPNAEKIFSIYYLNLARQKSKPSGLPCKIRDSTKNVI